MAIENRALRSLMACQVLDDPPSSDSAASQWAQTYIWKLTALTKHATIAFASDYKVYIVQFFPPIETEGYGTQR
jgi:hypothetical protein